MASAKYFGASELILKARSFSDSALSTLVKAAQFITQSGLCFRIALKQESFDNKFNSSLLGLMISISLGLEAKIDLEVSSNYYKTFSNLNLSEIFICSAVECEVSNNLENDDVKVNCEKVSGLKCERCWKISDDVNTDSSLCSRCTNVIDNSK